jgi:hypothetical protein
MALTLTIRDVPRDVRDTLASRAAKRGQSLQQHLRSELIELASRPTVDEVVERAQARVTATGSRLSRKQILSHRDSDRK